MAPCQVSRARENPLPQRPGDAFIDAGEAAGARMIAEAGVLPREMEMKKKLALLQQALAAETDPETDPDARRTLMAELADVQMRHDIEAKARRRALCY